MDQEHNHPSSSHIPHQSSASSSSNSNIPDRALRSSSRIKAAKEKGREESVTEPLAKRTRDKGKAKEVTSESTAVRSSKRVRKAPQPPTPAALIINEPSRDPKGKKRAAPESISEDESAATNNKKLKGSSSTYSLRSKKDTAQMPKKSSIKTSPKGKTSTKGKTVAAPGPSRRLEEEDDMMEVDFVDGVHDDDDDDDSIHDEDDEEVIDAEKRGGHEGGIPRPDTSAAETQRMMEESAFSMFGDISRLGGYMNQISSRLRTLLNNIKSEADPSTRLVALQELSELLSISTEDTLAGSFQVEGFVVELLRILGGDGGEAAQDDGDGDDDEGDNDDDAALAAALQMSTGNAYPGDENLEAQLLACRCLANLMEALPGCGHTLVYRGAVPVLCSKLIEISYIDLAEQTLITLEKISEEYPSAIVRDGGLSALLNYLDFFSIAVQRTALQAAANCCRNASADSFPMIKEVWPIIRNCLTYADQRVVDYASLCVIRVIDSYNRSYADKLEALIDTDLIHAVASLLLPAGGSSLVPANTFTLLLRGLATAARASPTITVSLLEADIVTILYQILTGVLPSSHDDSDEQGNSATGQGLGGGLADMTVMQNLAHRPKEQVEEALTLISELLPPLPKDGVFDHKGYSEKALHRMVKAKAKADRAAARAANAAAALQQAPPSRTQTPSSSRAHTPTGGPTTPAEDDTLSIPPPQESTSANDASESSSATKDVVLDRADLLKSKANVVNRFVGLIVPILVDVYAASVSVPIRIKSLLSLLKAVCFQEQGQLKRTLKNVPIASFASSILSSKDHPNLMIGALQLVELLLAKGSGDYKASFRREGVLHEIEILAARPLPPKTKDKDQSKENEGTPVPDLPDPSLPPMIPTGSSSRKPQLLDPEDAYTLRGRVIKFKYLSGDIQGEGDATFASLRHLVDVFAQKTTTEAELRSTIKEMTELFASPRSTVSSFELLQSGLVGALLELATSKEGSVDLRRRQRMLIQELCAIRDGKPVTTVSPFAVLVKKLQESLTRMESFEVITVTPGLEDSKRNSASLLARQIRLRLVAAEGSDTPRSCNNIIVSIHAIATFQALNDYLRPRLSGLLSNLSGARFSSMLAALASGRYMPGGLSSRLAESSASPSGTTVPPPLPPPDTNGSTASDHKPPERRRSQRLNAKASSTSLAESASASASVSDAPASALGALSSAASTSATVATSRPRDFSRDDLLSDLASREATEAIESHAGDFMDADIDADMLGEGLEDDETMAERTINLSVADDGSKVVAQTPEGTRVATPNPMRDQNPSTSSSSASSAAKQSYASALKNKASDWHLEFSMDDHVLPLDMTIYGAVHQHEVRKTSGPPVPLNMIWQGVYTVKYKKVAGPRPSPEARQDNADSRARSPIPNLTSLLADASHSKILRLLRVLHKLNSQVTDEDLDKAQALPETAFINNKLTAKLTRQLEEPMIVASACLPDWAMDLPLHFPFLFPFTTRFSFLQSTSFGYARLILKWQSQQTRSQESSRRDDTFGFLGRLQRQKVRISREHILQSAFKVFELYGSSSSILEVEYFDEVGTGLGPTLEFYSLVSKEFARRDLKIWRDVDTTYPGVYVHHPHGLFPAPIAKSEGGKNNEKRIYVFRTIGQFVAKAMLDSRIIDMSFNKIFLKLILGEEVPLTIASLKHVDPGLANSLSKMQACVPSDNEDPDSESEYPDQLMNIEDLMLDFTLPGYDIELKPNGRNIPVTRANVKEYIHEVIDAIIGEGAMQQAKAFREGFSKVFPVTDLLAFSADELVILFGSAEEDWSTETLGEALKADHGFNVESTAIRDLVTIMSEYDAQSRRNFLQFITGSPKLPIGGFRGLNPPLTVVRKPHEPPLTADDYLPSVMTCVNYLKLPQYSTKEVMREKLDVAMKEGVGSFHLS